jgi:IS1 family transposase
VVWERTQPVLQELVDGAPKAKQYYSDAFEAYDHLWYYWGRYAVSEGKTDTFLVEGDNAELRHYLARLARASICFSRCPYALACALRLFIFCYNRRQLYKQLYPAYPAHIKDFLVIRKKSLYSSATLSGSSTVTPFSQPFQ